jgi:MoxR-like ATPase
MSREKFIESITRSYSSSGASIYLGAGIFQAEIVSEARVNLPLRMMNRHGLVTGATGSGKTRTLQLLAEQLSAAGVPVFMPDPINHLAFPLSFTRLVASWVHK